MSSKKSNVDNGESLIAASLKDLFLGLKLYSLWGRLGWNDILNKHQRSLLGPLWLTISMGVLIGALGFLYASLFKIDLAIYLPFLTVGFVLWQLISGIILDGCNVFVGSEGIIKQVKLPFAVHVYRILYKNLLTFFHNAAVVLVVMYLFDVYIGWYTLFIFPALFLLIINGAWLALLLGMLCARYRDLNPTIGSLVQLSFFVTPIIWSPSLLPERQFILLYNPFYHFVESIRGPILGTPVALESWYIIIGITILGWAITIPLAGKMQRKLVYWL
ncbi:ABC transporter permease [Rhodospirillaceae bacterium]|nr:ABC transporter permease [Rhodospirillaceae bacterium]